MFCKYQKDYELLYPDYVFVKSIFEGEDWWERVHISAVKGREIIHCSEPGCNNYAIVLDHYYPYHSEHNRCVEHKT